MRPEEVYRVRPENVKLAGGYLFNPYGKTKAARRRVTLNSTARHVLASRMADLRGRLRFRCDIDPAGPVPKVNSAHDRAVRASRSSNPVATVDLATPGRRGPRVWR